MILALIQRLRTSDDVVARGLRFACVGSASGAIFAAVTALLIRGFKVDPVLASVAGYCAAVPTSFLGHRGFSFRSKEHLTGDAARFTVAQTLNIAVTAGVMRVAIETVRISYIWGMIGAVVLVPMANFVLMHLWVFARTNPVVADTR